MLLAFLCCCFATNGFAQPDWPDPTDLRIGDTLSVITGHFYNKKQLDTLAVVKVHIGTDMMDDPDKFAVRFADVEEPIYSGGRAMWLVREGDLTGDGIDEFSIFSKPLNGHWFNFSTYRRKKHGWEILYSFLYPTEFQSMNDTDLHSLVYSKKGKIYCKQKELREDGSYVQIIQHVRLK